MLERLHEARLPVVSSGRSWLQRFAQPIVDPVSALAEVSNLPPRILGLCLLHLEPDFVPLHTEILIFVSHLRLATAGLRRLGTVEALCMVRSMGKTVKLR